MSFKEMPVWVDAMNVAEEVFKFAEGFPKKEDYGLTSQLRRAALSISANIAEAYGRNHTLDKIKFYYYSRGSVSETQSHIEYGRRIGYINANIAENLD
ncbi:MAG: four helix bundle protein [Melioribacteraceae bacterium]|nr:four helix bundle protein [Melioribacteraceae bacterium]